MTVNIKALIGHSIGKLKRARETVRYRRVNWNVAAELIHQEFSLFTEECINSHFPYQFRVFNYKDQPNENSVQIDCCSFPPTNLKKINCSVEENPHIFETGGKLVASQGYQGFILFIYYPLKTDKADPNFKELLISPLIDPGEINRKFLKKILGRFLLLTRFTSLHGDETISPIERMKISFIFFLDMRYKHTLMKSIISMQNEWAKLIFVAVASAVITYYLSGK